ncbi:copper resistance protein NlpE [Alkalitalea saponilacus]|uniref:Uncharacterized lipoprotein NlpE involved in copper resistance n=1 Tax=Alkalitalea saponilacus TaxID=889453 RepID=A0A1T5G5L1_9BACT|nr:copper resistance protein NlpE [Alkalitalea saponilacus]ASB47857.1 copper resistance protein NlpE [Alkalitalea saponilacus]SKC03604.1 Uncharacterized lipoprotein NlpE involved in copper resistance [Alkalitalea saponilacus]
MKFYCFILVAAFVFSGCFYSGGKDEQHSTGTMAEAPDMHTSQIALDWDGVYFGVLPCASCEGTETTLEIHADHTFGLSRTYLGKDVEPFLSHGTFEWDSSGSKIIIDEGNDFTTIYFVGEGFLLQLDMDGQRIDGSLADKYRLIKQAE